MSGHPIERFDPLLRNLLSWGLVEETAGGWALRDDVSARLTHLTQLTSRNAPGEVVFFGHACAVCRSSGLTRLRDGRYLCEACRRAEEVAAVATPLPKPADRKAKRSVIHRVRDVAS